MYNKRAMIKSFDEAIKVPLRTIILEDNLLKAKMQFGGLETQIRRKIISNPSTANLRELRRVRLVFGGLFNKKVFK